MLRQEHTGKRPTSKSYYKHYHGEGLGDNNHIGIEIYYMYPNHDID